LVELVAALDGSALEGALHFLAAIRARSAVPALLQQLEHRPHRMSMAFGNAIATIGGSRALKGLEDLLGRVTDLVKRHGIVYGLVFLCDSQAAPALLSLLRNERELADLRGLAAEGLAYSLEGARRRSKIWRQAVRSLFAALEDKHVEVRFWSVFALGTLRVIEAIPDLRKISQSDHAICRSMGLRVSREALEAIYCIENGEWPDTDFLPKLTRI